MAYHGWKLAALLALFTASSWATPQIGKPAPAFAVRDNSGQLQTLGDHLGNIVVLEWTNFNCPEVKRRYEGKMQALQRDYTEKGVVWLTVISSASGKRGHISPEQANELQKQLGANATAVLLDESGGMGRAFDASVTPQVFVIGIEGALAYMGAIDGGKDNATPHLSRAIDAVMAREPVEEPVTEPQGCPIRY